MTFLQGIVVALAKWVLEFLGKFIFQAIKRETETGDRNAKIDARVKEMEEAIEDIKKAKASGAKPTKEQKERLKRAARRLAERAAN